MKNNEVPKNNMQVYRESKGFTQEELARQLNISLRYYQQLEYQKYRPNVFIALKFSKILNVDPYDIFPIYN